MKVIAISFLSISAFVSIIVAKNSILYRTESTNIKPKHTSVKKSTSKILALNKYGRLAKTYTKANDLYEDYCFLIDMKQPSGKRRFFVYNLKNDSILHEGLVTHGGGSGTYDIANYFCNIPNSGATSLGKYKIGNEYSGKFGMAFKLYGLESTNSKAFERFVVLHAHSCVPENEVYPSPICTSLGCPTVSPSFLPILKKYIDNAAKPVLLWIYK